MIFIYNGDNERIQSLLRRYKTMNKRDGFSIELSDNEYFKIDNHRKTSDYLITESNAELVFILSINKVNFNKIAFMWDSINLTDKEDKIIKALQIIESNIERNRKNRIC